MGKNLLESIKCLDGEVFHLEYHQNRVNQARKRLGFNSILTLSLNPPKKGLYRCRIVYEKEIDKIEYLKYTPKKIDSFKLVFSTLSYDMKYEDRGDLNTLMSKEADEIIIVKNDLVTDTSISNLCFFNGKEWLTPKSPLLEGTTRARLLKEKKIKPADIHYKEIKNFEKIAMINAMIDFSLIENAIIL